jgi:hypothetical protein
LRRSRPEDDPKARGRLVWALLLKLLGGLALYWVTFKFYKGGDVDLYHPAAVVLAGQFRHGNFAIHIPGGLGLVGPGFIEVVAGVVYAIIGTSKMAGFLVFAWLGFWGLYFFYRAFQIAVSEETAKRYARLVFFLPSLLFWSSSIGKDAWMVFALGVASYGVARMLTHRRGGFLVAATGLTGTALVRPHVTLMIMVGVLFAYALRRSGRDTGHSRLAKVIGLTVLIAGSALLVGQVEKFLHINNLGQQSVNHVLSTESAGSNYGGSAYTVQNPSLANYPLSAVTVLFRPFPWEAHSSQQIAASLEGVFLMSVLLRSVPRFRGLLRRLRETPYVAYALAYSLVFMPFFSSFANFGLLVRERDQLYPLLFVLLALPMLRKSRYPYQRSVPMHRTRSAPHLVLPPGGQSRMAPSTTRDNRPLLRPPHTRPPKVTRTPNVRLRRSATRVTHRRPPA